jgi:hypothetical protein
MEAAGFGFTLLGSLRELCVNERKEVLRNCYHPDQLYTVLPILAFRYSRPHRGVKPILAGRHRASQGESWVLREVDVPLRRSGLGSAVRWRFGYGR